MGMPRIIRRNFGIRGFALCAALSATAGLSACDDSDQASQNNAQEAPSVIVAGVSSREISQSANFIGRTEPVDAIDLKARVAGFLEERAVDDGVHVNAGDILFRIEPAQYEAAVAQARADVAEGQANLALADLELQRKTTLLASDTIAQAEYDSALASREAAAASVDAREAMVRQAEIDLAYTEMPAPFDGRIGRIAFSRGDVVGPDSGPIATLVRVSPIYVDFALSESQFLTLAERIGAKLDADVDPANSPPVTLLLANRTEFDETGSVVFIDNTVDPLTGTISLRARFENARGLLTPGMFVTVTIEAEESQTGLVLPQSAVQRDQKGSFALVVGSEGLVEQRYVELGDQLETDVVIESGLQEGESVIVEGLQRVRPGVPVNAVRATNDEG